MSCILNRYRKDKCGDCSKLCQHRIALEGLDGKSGRLGNAGLPDDYFGITLNNSPVKEGQTKIYELLEKYIETFWRDDGGIKSMYFWSENPGTGKTTTAAALISEWIAVDYLKAIKDGKQPRQFSAYFLDINVLQARYNMATMTNDEEEMQSIGNEIKRTQTAPFAVIDDIGVRNSTEAFRAYVHTVINHRVSNGLPTVYTSNFPVEEMADVFDSRLYDRIRHQCATVHFKGESKRGRR